MVWGRRLFSASMLTSYMWASSPSRKRKFTFSCMRRYSMIASVTISDAAVTCRQMVVCSGSAIARSCSGSASRRCISGSSFACKNLPYSVSTMFRPRVANSCTPSSASSRLIDWDSDGCAMCSRSALRVMCWVRATSRK